MERIKSIAKAIFAAGASGVAAYAANTPANITELEPWLWGLGAAFVGGIGTYFIKNQKKAETPTE